MDGPTRLNLLRSVESLTMRYDIGKNPADFLHKFLAIAGMVIIVTSICFPVAMHWQQQLLRNSLEGEIEKHQLRNQALAAEIDRLKHQRDELDHLFKDQGRSLEFARFIMTAEVIASYRKAEAISAEQLDALETIQMEGFKLLQKLESLNGSGEETERKRELEYDKLKTLLQKATMGMPKYIAEVALLTLKGLRLLDELERLESAVPVNAAAVEAKLAEVDSVTAETTRIKKWIEDANVDDRNRRKATLIAQSMDGFSQAFQIHFQFERLHRLVRISELQMEARVLEMQSSDVELQTKTKELDLLTGQQNATIIGGIVGLVCGLCATYFGATWWYGADRVAAEQRIAELIAAKAKAEEPAKREAPSKPVSY